MKKFKLVLVVTHVIFGLVTILVFVVIIARFMRAYNQISQPTIAAILDTSEVEVLLTQFQERYDKVKKELGF